MALADFQVNLTKLKNAITQLLGGQLEKLTTVVDRLNEHTAATGNVHDLEPRDIGLGNVPDWTPATLTQARNGVSNNAFMTPRRVDNYADENIFAVIGDAFQDAANDL